MKMKVSGDNLATVSELDTSREGDGGGVTLLTSRETPFSATSELIESLASELMASIGGGSMREP